MRIATTLLLTGLSGLVHAQDWALFPLGQHCCFLQGSGPGEHALRVDRIDSVRTNGNGQTFLFDTRIPIANGENCGDERPMEQWMFLMDDPLRIDSLTERNDSVRCHFPFTNASLLFLPKAAVGTTWAGSSISQFTCTEVTEELVLGVTDSVRTFEVTLNGEPWGPVPVVRTVRLSRDHGLLGSVPLRLMVPHPGGPSTESLYLIRQSGPGGTFGPPLPQYEDFFHPAVGDVRFWKEEYTSGWAQNPSWFREHLDSITSVTYYTDSILLTKDRTTREVNGTVSSTSSLSERIHRSSHGAIAPMTPKHLVVDQEPYLSIATGDHPVWYCHSYVFDIPSEPGDTIVRTTVVNAFMLNTEWCMVEELIDHGCEMSFDSRVGSYRSSLWSNPDNTTWTLLGSVIDGIQEGQIIHLGVGDIAGNRNLVIHPSPANAHIRVSGTTSQRTPYRILDRTGRMLQQGILLPEGLDVSALIPGLYLLQLEEQHGTISGRFVKE